MVSFIANAGRHINYERKIDLIAYCHGRSLGITCRDLLCIGYSGNRIITACISTGFTVHVLNYTEHNVIGKLKGLTFCVFALKFGHDIDAEVILECERTCVCNSEICNFGYAGLPVFVGEDVCLTGNICPFNTVPVLKLNIKITGLNNVVCRRYGIREPSKRRTYKH